MRFKILVLLSLLLLPASQSMAYLAGVTSVQVVPSAPTDLDYITFNVAGWMSDLSVEFAGAEFGQIGTFLQLDLFFYSTAGPGDIILPIAVPLDYSHQIAPLSPGTYTLEVSAISPPDGSSDIVLPYTRTFTVTPEPASIALLGLGTILLRKRK